MNLTMDGNTMWVLIIACLCGYWAVDAWAKRNRP
jgi:hypothetical protein